MKNKKAEITWRYIVGGIIALLALIIIFYLIFHTRSTMIETFDNIKGLF